jgi:tetratricopeptide (TPR) repeat protein
MISIDEFRKFKENSKEYLRGYLRRYFKNSLKGNSNKKILVSILATNPLFLPLSMTLLGESLLLKLMFKEEFDAYNNYKSGSEFYKKKEYYKSLNFYKNAVKLDPNDADYKAHLADTYNKINKNNEAIDLYQEVIIILPENNEYRNKLISLYYQENRNDDVKNHLKKITFL